MDLPDRAPPPATTVNVTTAPCKPAPDAVVTLTMSGAGSGWPTGPVWRSPEIRANADGLGAPVGAEASLAQVATLTTTAIAAAACLALAMRPPRARHAGPPYCFWSLQEKTAA